MRIIFPTTEDGVRRKETKYNNNSSKIKGHICQSPKQCTPWMLWEQCTIARLAVLKSKFQGDYSEGDNTEHKISIVAVIEKYIQSQKLHHIVGF